MAQIRKRVVPGARQRVVLSGTLKGGPEVAMAFFLSAVLNSVLCMSDWLLQTGARQRVSSPVAVTS
jgi:hypothetical protein